MLKKLEDSGLDAQDAKKLGMLPKVNGDARDLTGYDTPGFTLPYFDIAGKPTGFWRYRNFGKTKAKYVQAPNTGVAVYFPPIGDAKWAERIKEPTLPVFITEGELKAASATKAGFATMGLGGVWSFKSKKKEQEFIPDLEQFDWHGRHTYICFDSDATTNEKVMQAETALADALFKHGARVYIIRLPALSKDGKTGLDDFLMHPKGGIKKFHRLIETAEEWSKCGALRKFNNEVIFIFDPGVCVVRATDQRIDPGKMAAVHYADRTFMKSTPTKVDPLKRTETSVPQEWMKWSERAVAQRQTYSPGKPRMINNEYNRWKGWGATPHKGSVAPWTKLMDFIFKDANPADRKWFEQWLAFPIQNPGIKMLSSCIIWGIAHGTGKTLVGETMRRIYGTDNSTEIGDKELEAGFNDWAANKQFIFGNEITGSDKRGHANALKNLITQTRIRVNEKFVPAYEVPDCANYLWTANHNDAFYLEKSDRRFFVVEVVGGPMDPHWYSGVYDPWYKSAKGIGALMHYFKNLDMTGFNPNHSAPMTESKAQVIEENMSDMASWVDSIAAHPRAHRLMSSEEILLMASGDGKMAWTKTGLSRAVRAAGFIRPLGDISHFTTPDGKRVRPWLLDKEANVPKSRAKRAKWMKDMWEEDRKPKPKKITGGGK